MSDGLDEDKPFVVRVGPLDIDWARPLGFYGGIATAVAVGVVAPELAVFIAVVPLVKLFKRRNASLVEKFGAAVIEGAAKPLGGDAEEAVRPAWEDEEKQQNETDRKSAQRGSDHVETAFAGALVL